MELSFADDENKKIKHTGEREGGAEGNGLLNRFYITYIKIYSKAFGEAL